MQDNYCAPTYGVFYEHLPVETARDLRHRFAFHCTPERGSWLNVAEIELAALSRQCLDRRIGCPHQLEQEALA